jgi:parallel beta-helix repeat protein
MDKRYVRAVAVVGVALIGGMCESAAAADLCVNPGGKAGCFMTIGAAITAASPNDTIRVGSGTYKESVVIGKPLSVIGAHHSNTVIDATGQPNGVFIDGIHNPGLSHVLVAGFTVRNASFEGVLVANASSVTVYANRVVLNDKSLQLNPAPSCPGLPSFETLEGFDCGEGIHLTGVDHSTVAHNLVENNAGGILLSDDTGATHDNVITGNVVRNNQFDCGITLASHPPALLTSSSSPLGVFHNTVSGNESSSNGLAVEGAGAGVGIFASVPGAQTYGNVVINNRLTGNGLPGVALHSHTPGQILNDNAIIGNVIARNGKDTEDTATSGPTGINISGVSPISGTIILHNVIMGEAIDIAVNTPGDVDAHLNDLLGSDLGVENLGSGKVDARDNWWKCAHGPGAPGCTKVNVGPPAVLVKPWLSQPVH